MKAQDSMYVKFICFVRGTRWKLKIVCMLSLYVLGNKMKAQDSMYVKFVCFVRGTRWKLKIVCMLNLYVLSGEQDESSR